MIISKDAKAIYAEYDIFLDDVDAVLVAHNCNTQSISSSKTAQEWAHIWAAAENNNPDLSYAEVTRGH
jgi:hypothetical protein